jgi:hypothetical protein
MAGEDIADIRRLHWARISLEEVEMLPGTFIAYPAEMSLSSGREPL